MFWPATEERKQTKARRCKWTEARLKVDTMFFQEVINNRHFCLQTGEFISIVLDRYTLLRPAATDVGISPRTRELHGGIKEKLPVTNYVSDLFFYNIYYYKYIYIFINILSFV